MVATWLPHGQQTATWSAAECHHFVKCHPQQLPQVHRPSSLASPQVHESTRHQQTMSFQALRQHAGISQLNSHNSAQTLVNASTLSRGPTRARSVARRYEDRMPVTGPATGPPNCDESHNSSSCSAASRLVDMASSCTPNRRLDLCFGPLHHRAACECSRMWPLS
jgi:hypothetical protein